MQFGTIIERASVDEAYIDLTTLVSDRMQNYKVVGHDLKNTFVVGHEHETSKDDWLKETFCEINLKTDNVRLAIGATIVEEMRNEIFKQTNFQCSAGVAHNKVLAKLTCGLHKPNKQTILPQDQVPVFFEKFNLNNVRGLGGKLGEHISETFQIQTMGQLSNISLLDLRKHFDEKTTTWLFNIAKGIEHEAVKPRDLPKSIGELYENFV